MSRPPAATRQCEPFKLVGKVGGVLGHPGFLLRTLGGCVTPGSPRVPSRVPLTWVQACVGAEGHWTAPRPQHGQRWAGEGCGRKGRGPIARSAGCTLGLPVTSLQSEGLQSLQGLRVGGKHKHCHKHPGFGRKASTAGSVGHRATPPEQPPDACCPPLLAACEVCMLRAPGACHPVSTRTKALLSGSGFLEPHAQQIRGRAWLGPFWPECRGTSVSPGTWGWPPGGAGALGAEGIWQPAEPSPALTSLAGDRHSSASCSLWPCPRRPGALL